MQGSLRDTPLPDLVRGLASSSATGAVEVQGPDGEARVLFRDGAVYWAASPAPRARLGARLTNAGFITQDQLDEALEAQSDSSERKKLGELLVDRGLVARDVIRVFVQEQILDAAFDLMRWSTGHYTFEPGPAGMEDLPVDIAVAELLVEISRRQMEWDQITRAIQSLDAVPDFVTGGSSASAALEPDEFTMMANIDGMRSVRDLADDLGYSEFEAARIVYGLTLLGIVEITDDADDDDESEPVAAVPPASTPAPAVDPVAEWLDEGPAELPGKPDMASADLYEALEAAVSDPGIVGDDFGSTTTPDGVRVTAPTLGTSHIDTDPLDPPAADNRLPDGVYVSTPDAEPIEEPAPEAVSDEATEDKEDDGGPAPWVANVDEKDAVQVADESSVPEPDFFAGAPDNEGIHVVEPGEPARDVAADTPPAPEVVPELFPGPPIPPPGPARPELQSLADELDSLFDDDDGPAAPVAPAHRPAAAASAASPPQATPPPAPGAPTTPPPAPGATPPPAPGAPTGPPPAPGATPPPAPGRDVADGSGESRGDVSAFLRELTQLGNEEDIAPDVPEKPAAPSRRAQPPAPVADDKKKKRRFGWGG